RLCSVNLNKDGNRGALMKPYFCNFPVRTLEAQISFKAEDWQGFVDKYSPLALCAVQCNDNLADNWHAMKKFTLLQFTILGLLLFPRAGLGQNTPVFSESPTPWADSVLAALDLDAKIGQLFMVAAY